MKTLFDSHHVADTVAQPVDRPLMVNEVTDRPACTAAADAKGSARPHILSQRATRWARRAAY